MPEMFAELRKLLDQFEKGMMTGEEYGVQVATILIKYNWAKELETER